MAAAPAPAPSPPSLHVRAKHGLGSHAVQRCRSPQGAFFTAAAATARPYRKPPVCCCRSHPHLPLYPAAPYSHPSSAATTSAAASAPLRPRLRLRHLRLPAQQPAPAPRGESEQLLGQLQELLKAKHALKLRLCCPNSRRPLLFLLPSPGGGAANAGGAHPGGDTSRPATHQGSGATAATSRSAGVFVRLQRSAGHSQAGAPAERGCLSSRSANVPSLFLFSPSVSPRSSFASRSGRGVGP